MKNNKRIYLYTKKSSKRFEAQHHKHLICTDYSILKGENNNKHCDMRCRYTITHNLLIEHFLQAQCIYNGICNGL